jgi:hypothetical protein
MHGDASNFFPPLATSDSQSFAYQKEKHPWSQESRLGSGRVGSSLLPVEVGKFWIFVYLMTERSLEKGVMQGEIVAGWAMGRWLEIRQGVDVATLLKVEMKVSGKANFQRMNLYQ